MHKSPRQQYFIQINVEFQMEMQSAFELSHLKRLQKRLKQDLSILEEACMTAVNEDDWRLLDNLKEKWEHVKTELSRVESSLHFLTMSHQGV
jgi:uncharacterized protein (DUF2252 family)